MAQPLAKGRIVVGLDFGTTYSGVAFTYSGSPNAANEISIIKNWPGGNNITSDKVPSELAFVKTPTTSRGTKRAASGRALPAPTSGPTETMIWGYQIQPEQERLRYLNLLLDPRQQLPDHIDRKDLEDQLAKHHKTPIEATTQLLIAIDKETKEALIRHYGASMVATTEIVIVMTVPAVWSDAAKDATMKAAEAASLDSRLVMISEPEAAAVYSLKAIESHALRDGDNFIICDAGGGTVDLISYEIYCASPLRLKESAPGTGAVCGGAFLNERFKQLVRSRMGATRFDNMCRRKPKTWAIGLKYFEDYVKRNFDPAGDAYVLDVNKFNVPLPGAANNAEAGIDSGFITLSTGDVADIFRPIIDQVIGLVQRQRQLVSAFGKTAKGVILVGGFGQSNHLYKSLRTRFADEDPPPPYSQTNEAGSIDFATSRFVVSQPMDAWTAVVRGAVLTGLDDTKIVLSRRARRHYGVWCARKFDPDKDSIECRIWDEITEEYRANKQITWHIKKGQIINSGEPVLLRFASIKERADKIDTVRWSLIVSDEEEAPSELITSTPLTRVLCELTADVKDIPQETWRKKRGPSGKAYSSLSQDIGMEIRSGGLFFDCRVGGVVVGSVRADYE